MEPITLAILGAVGYYAYEKNKNPAWTPFASLLAHPHEKLVALEKVKVTSVPTPHDAAALDPNMTTEQVKQVNTTLMTETDPQKIASHAQALSALGHDNSANALAAKANAVGEAKALGASDTDIHLQHTAAVAAPTAVGWGPAITGAWGPTYTPEQQAATRRNLHERLQMPGRGRGRDVGYGRGGQDVRRGEVGRGRGLLGSLFGRGHTEPEHHYRHHAYVPPQQGFGMQPGFGIQPGGQPMDDGAGDADGAVDVNALAAEFHLTPEQIRQLQRRFQMERRNREVGQRTDPNVTMHPHHRRKHHHHPEAIQTQQQIQQVQPDPNAGVVAPDAGAAAATTADAGAAVATPDAGATATQGWFPEPFGPYGYDPYSNSGFGGYGSIGWGGPEGLGGYGSWGSFGGWGHGL